MKKPAPKKRRMRITFEIDVERKGFDRKAFNAKVVAFFASADKGLSGETVLLTTEEVQ